MKCTCYCALWSHTAALFVPTNESRYCIVNSLSSLLHPNFPIQTISRQLHLLTGTVTPFLATYLRPWLKTEFFCQMKNVKICMGCKIVWIQDMKNVSRHFHNFITQQTNWDFGCFFYFCFFGLQRVFLSSHQCE